MRSVATFLIVLVGSLLPAAAQGEQVIGQLRGPERLALAGADLEFVPDAEPLLPALASLRQPLPARLGRSDDKGRFKLPATGPGSLLATTTTGLGAFTPFAFPGAPVDMPALLPMAEVALPDGASFTLHPAWLCADGTRRLLPPRTGTAVRLPAGSYECWLLVDDSARWLRLDLRPSQRCVVAVAPPLVATLLRQPGTEVRPDARPDVRLLGEGRDRCVLLGEAGRAGFTALWRERGLAIDHLSAPSSATPLAFPLDASPAVERRTLRFSFGGQPAAGTEVLGLRDDLHPAGFAIADQDGRVSLACHPGMAERTEVIFWLPGCAVQQTTFAHLDEGGTIALLPGSSIAVACVDADGGPAAGVELEYTPTAAPLASTAARTDSRGRTRIPATQRPGILRIVDPRFLNQDVEVSTGEQTTRVQLQDGARIHGRVTMPDGKPAEGAMVALRDPAGRLRPSTRTAVADQNGAFSFAGLPDDGDFVLFAQQIASAHTFSVKLVRVQAATEPLQVALRDEDPPLPRGDR